MMKELLYNEIKKMPLIDTHEHIPHERDCSSSLDVFDFLLPYVCDNLCSAGVNAKTWGEMNDKRLRIEDRISLAFPYIESIRYTTYFRAFEESVKALGEYEFSKKGLKRAGEILAKNNDLKLVYAKINAERGMTFMGYSGMDYFNDSKFLKVVPTVSQITPKVKEDILLLSNSVGVEINSFEGLITSIEKLFIHYEQNGVKNIKIGSSYTRRPDYSEPNLMLAREQFDRIYSGDINLSLCNGELLQNYDITPIKELDDFIIDKCLLEAERRGMSVIIHTGIHAWNVNALSAVSPSPLEYIIRKYKNLKFILLHLGYPYVDDAILLAKYFPNVCLDMAWLHVLDEKTAVQAIKKAVCHLPTSKICAFGGDYCQPSNILGAYEFAVRNLSKAFADLIEDGVMELPEAKRIISAWLYDNPKRIYEL